MIEPKAAVLANCYIGAPVWVSVLYTFDAAVCPICVIGASVWVSVSVRIGRYLLASVETKTGKRNKPNMINHCA